MLQAPPGARKNEWTIGSQDGRDILFKSEGVSAFHAKIVNEGMRWKVIDQLSANGTFVNGRRCTVSALTSADRITFGPVECIFQLPKGSEAPAAGRGRLWKRLAISVGILLLIG